MNSPHIHQQLPKPHPSYPVQCCHETPPKNTVFRLQPLDQGSIALMKKAYMQYMMAKPTTTRKASDNITEPAKKVTVCDAVLKTKVTWDSIHEVASASDGVESMMSWGDLKASPANESLDSCKLAFGCTAQAKLGGIYGL